MAGITRINITDQTNGRGAWRFIEARKCWPAAHKLYATMFDQIGMPIQDGIKIVDCTLAEFEDGYDYQLGIDVFLRFMSDQVSTLQEKFLFTNYMTLTVEFMQDWRNDVQGDWFNLKCQYYLCGYPTDDKQEFRQAVLVDWPRLQLATAQGRMRWWENKNGMDNARASFKYVYFNDIPADVLIYRHGGKPIKAQLSLPLVF